MGSYTRLAIPALLGLLIAAALGSPVPDTGKQSEAEAAPDVSLVVLDPDGSPVREAAVFAVRHIQHDGGYPWPADTVPSYVSVRQLEDWVEAEDRGLDAIPDYFASIGYGEPHLSQLLGRTDDSGRFTGDLPASAGDAGLGINVVAYGFEPANRFAAADASPLNARIVLARRAVPASVRVRVVTESGEPVDGAMVRIASTEAPHERQSFHDLPVNLNYFSPSSHRDLLTGRNGAIRLPASQLTDEYLHATVLHPNFPAHVQLNIAPDDPARTETSGRADLVLRLPTGRTLNMRAVTPDGRPCALAEVTLYGPPEGDDEWPVLLRRRFTDKDGRLALPVPTNAVSFKVEPMGSFDTLLRSLDGVALDSAEPIDIVEPGNIGTIMAQVITPDGDRLSTFNELAACEIHLIQSSALSAGRIGLASSGTYFVGPDRAEWRERKLAATRKLTSDESDWVYYEEPTPGRQYQPSVADDGRARAVIRTNIEDGQRGRILVTHPRWGATVGPWFDLACGTIHDEVVDYRDEPDLAGLQRLSGRITDPDGEPVPGATVHAAGDGWRWAAIATNEDGRYETIVPTGNATLTIDGPRHQQLPITIEPGDTGVLVVDEVLQPLPSITGRLVPPAGQPLPRDLSLTPTVHVFSDGRYSQQYRGPLGVTLDSETGEFRIDRMPLDTDRLRLTIRGQWSAFGHRFERRHTIEVTRDHFAAPVDVPIPAPVTVTGSVTLPDGSPATAASIELRRADRYGRQAVALPCLAVDPATGRFTVGPIATPTRDDMASLRIALPGYQEVIVQLADRAGERELPAIQLVATEE